MSRLPLPLILILLTGVLQTASGEVDYTRDIKPLLAEKCSTCHGAIRQEAGLRLDHGRLLRQGSDDGAIIDALPLESKLLQRVTTHDLAERMPPESEGTPLTDEQIQLLKDWIANGAVSPEDEAIPVGPDQHWAWQPLVRPALPPHAATRATDHPIDAFIRAKLAQHDLAPLPLATSDTLLRRVYFDLIGLPPTLEQQQAFRNDTEPQAWSRLVERLLEDPAHGERWARHWMDVWRYSDWDGYKEELRGGSRHIWRWRDWIIESLNEDKGYDRMIVEMLAGDEVAPRDENVLRATGFLARNHHKSNRNMWLDATVEHTAKAFLATTINCARCHDHKYDPLSQREYYAFRAIFEPHQVRTERLHHEKNTMQDGLARAFDAKLDEPTYLYVAGDEKHPDKENPVEPDVPGLLGFDLNIAPVTLPAEAVFPSLRGFVEQQDLAATEQKLTKAKDALSQLTTRIGESKENSAESQRELLTQAFVAAEANIVSLKARWTADKLKYGDERELDETTRKTAVRAEHLAAIANARLVVFQKREDLRLATSLEKAKDTDVEKSRKELQTAEEQLKKISVPPSSDKEYTSVGESYPKTSTGRRLALANWITCRDNPLTARVAVNYVWMHHFGEPLVANVFDFGLRSPEPMYRALLDWLAVELMEHDWSLKHLHRLIVNSQTYRLASSTTEPFPSKANQQVDPDNHLYWRANVRRLEAEAIRDSLLHTAGSLDLTQGGPDIDFALGESVARRSIYFRHALEKQMKMLVLFDAAAPTECYRRKPSIIPQQALALANGPLSIGQARVLAAKLAKSTSRQGVASPTDGEYIKLAFRVLLGRDCTNDELQSCDDFLAQQTSLLSDPKQLTLLNGKSVSQTAASQEATQRARENLIHTLMNHNDFVTLR